MSVPTERLVFSFIELALESCGQASPMTRLWRAKELNHGLWVRRGMRATCGFKQLGKGGI